MFTLTKRQVDKMPWHIFVADNCKTEFWVTSSFVYKICKIS